MPGTIRTILSRSPLGPLLRRCYARWRPPSPELLQTVEDDRLADAVMIRVLRSDSNCIDVGCHEGAMLQRMIDLAPRGRHFAFEPIPDFYARLRERFPGVAVHECALSDAHGTAEFVHVANMPAYSGLRRRDYPANETPEIRTITVRTEMLDDLLDPDFPVSLIKVDVEGGEWHVFRGARRTLSRWHPHVLFEHAAGGARHYGVTPEMIYDLLDEAGLQISGLPEWLAGAPPFTRERFIDATLQFWNFIAHPPRDQSAMGTYP